MHPERSPMKKWDFSGYATKNDIKCTDGRIIRSNAFQHHDGAKVPLVWQHMRNTPENILGHAILEHREDGVYTYGVFNSTENGQRAKTLVKEGDITSLSIFANGLKQDGPNVTHGNIREVSLVLSGANPGAVIENVSMSHGEIMFDIDAEDVVIYSGETLQHEDEEDDLTFEEIIDGMTPEQAHVLYSLVGQAAAGELDLDEEEDEEESEDEDEDYEDEELEESEDEDEDEEYYEEDEDAEHSAGGTNMPRNVFEGQEDNLNELAHDAFETIMSAASKGSMSEAFIEHAGEYGITNIEMLFPDHKNVTNQPTFIQREMGWVSKVMSGVHHTPFSRIKSIHADITKEEARALGYIKGNEKLEEVFELMNRVTGPQTIYKKQKLDRDDIIDITDFDVVAWLKAEMRMMLDEELARAFLVGDGREVTDKSKIKAVNIRPIASDDDLYAHKIRVASDATPEAVVEEIIRSRAVYRGKGTPTFYTTPAYRAELMLQKDRNGRRIYRTEAELAADLGVTAIVEVPVMSGVKNGENTVEGIIVNLKDYTVGADKGGAVNFFDDFDIDFNQEKFLIETRCSGALTLPKSALVIERMPAAVAGE